MLRYRDVSLQLYKKHIIIWLLIAIAIVVALKLGIDEKIIVFATLILEVVAVSLLLHFRGNYK